LSLLRYKFKSFNFKESRLLNSFYIAVDAPLIEFEGELSIKLLAMLDSSMASRVSSWLKQAEMFLVKLQQAL
jgi:hypothetical protein